MQNEYFIISSAARDRGDTSYAFYTLPRNMPEYQHAHVVGCLVASTANITAANNKIYYTTSADGPRIATIPPGIYTATTFPSIIKNVMDASGIPSYTVTNNNGILSITPSVGTLQMTFGTNKAAPAATQTAIALGFDPNFDTTVAAFQTAPNYMNLGYPQYLIFDVSLLGGAIHSVTDREVGTFAMLMDSNSGAYTLMTPGNTFDVSNKIVLRGAFHIAIRGPGGEAYAPSDYTILLHLMK